MCITRIEQIKKIFCRTQKPDFSLLKTEVTNEGQDYNEQCGILLEIEYQNKPQFKNIHIKKYIYTDIYICIYIFHVCIYIHTHINTKIKNKSL